MSGYIGTFSICGLPMLILNLVTAVLDIVVYNLDANSKYNENNELLYITAVSVIVYLAAFIINCILLCTSSENNSVVYLVLYIIFGVIVVIFNFFDGLQNFEVHPVPSFIFMSCGIVSMSILIIIFYMAINMKKDRPFNRPVEEQYNSGQDAVSSSDRPPLYPMLIEVEKAETSETQHEMLNKQSN